MEGMIHCTKSPGSEKPWKALFHTENEMVRLCDINIIKAVILRLKGDQIEVSFNCPAYTVMRESNLSGNRIRKEE